MPEPLDEPERIIAAAIWRHATGEAKEQQRRTKLTPTQRVAERRARAEAKGRVRRKRNSIT